MKVAVAGRLSLGGVKMRGVAVAERLGWDVIDVKKVGFLRPVGHYDAIVLVKYDHGAGPRLRRACDRFVYDPLDAWQSDDPAADPDAWWGGKIATLSPDDVLVTSPACEEAVAHAIRAGDDMPATSSTPGSPRLHLLPHHADPRIRPGVRDPNGPVVYAGEPEYLGDAAGRIGEAVRALGREFRVLDGADAVGGLAGASLSLCVRMPPHDTPLNRRCKPQVKLENAAAAGLCVLASDHPCIASLRPETVRIPDPPDRGHVVPTWVEHLRVALDAPPLANPVTLDVHAERLRLLLEDD